MTERTSRIKGFYKLSPKERLEKVKEFAGLTDEEVAMLANEGPLAPDAVDRMIENVVGTIELPLGIAVNFRINQKEYLVPMVTEEPSVVAAASNAAKMTLPQGFTTESTEPVMIGQIQVVGVSDPESAKTVVLEKRQQLLELANTKDPMLIKFGGGARDIKVEIVDAPSGKMIDVQLLVDTRDAMGANAVNTMSEAIAPMVEELTGGRTILKIITNLSIYRMARAKAVFPKEAVGGPESVDRIIQAYEFAVADVYRAATHNKGIMNGIIAVVLATGNDHRAVEAGAHAYAAFKGGYKPLTKYYKDENGDLVGEIELPMALGTVGGATKVHPEFKICQKIIGTKTAKEMAEVVAAVGLAQNFAALRALANEGIQKGHMSLHARNIAVMAGASGGQVDEVVKRMLEEGNIRMDRAKEILAEL